MHTVNLIVGAAILLALLAALTRILIRAYLKYNGERVITCPENQLPAGVALDVGHAVRTSLEGRPELRLNTCSRWPAREDCGQQCVHQIEAAPEDCLVRNILARWYEGKRCAMCDNPIAEINWTDHKPALLNAARQSVEWSEVPAEEIPAVLASHQPLCWNCHILNRMVGEHGELVIDRSRRI